MQINFISLHSAMILALVQCYHCPVKLKVISNPQMTHIQRISLRTWHYMCVCVIALFQPQRAVCAPSQNAAHRGDDGPV